jgi:hypothetical protein
MIANESHNIKSCFHHWKIGENEGNTPSAQSGQLQQDVTLRLLNVTGSRLSRRVSVPPIPWPHGNAPRHVNGHLRRHCLQNRHSRRMPCLRRRSPPVSPSCGRLSASRRPTRSWTPSLTGPCRPPGFTAVFPAPPPGYGPFVPARRHDPIFPRDRLPARICSRKAAEKSTSNI